MSSSERVLLPQVFQTLLSTRRPFASRLVISWQLARHLSATSLNGLLVRGHLVKVLGHMSQHHCMPDICLADKMPGAARLACLCRPATENLILHLQPFMKSPSGTFCDQALEPMENLVAAP